ncbi:hypothetical protein SDC9_194629 [bioreactor metagenome]|uniref:Uncharacterized protein n=1 Tax=bioreactor metagenome TaxID=1076179 RepID=A0A645I9C7_9ZZZZ
MKFFFTIYYYFPNVSSQLVSKHTSNKTYVSIDKTWSCLDLRFVANFIPQIQENMQVVKKSFFLYSFRSCTDNYTKAFSFFSQLFGNGAKTLSFVFIRYSFRNTCFLSIGNQNKITTRQRDSGGHSCTFIFSSCLNNLNNHFQIRL